MFYYLHHIFLLTYSKMEYLYWYHIYVLLLGTLISINPVWKCACPCYWNEGFNDLQFSLQFYEYYCRSCLNVYKTADLAMHSVTTLLYVTVWQVESWLAVHKRNSLFGWFDTCLLLRGIWYFQLSGQLHILCITAMFSQEFSQ